MRGRRWAAVAVAVLVGLLAAGCGPATPPEEPTTGASPEQDATAPMPTEISSALLECDEPEKGLPAAPTDLSGWTAAAPAGYHPGGEGEHFAPIEGGFEQVYFDHDVTDWPNQVGLNHFPQLEQGPVTDECGQLVPELVTARIALQAESGGAVVVAGPERTEVAGLPAWLATFEYPDWDLGNDNYFVYGTHELVHVECQWRDAYREDVRTACAWFLDHLSPG